MIQVNPDPTKFGHGDISLGTCQNDVNGRIVLLGTLHSTRRMHFKS